MTRVFITGSTTGLGRAAAEDLLAGGHEVVVHARNADRAASLDPLLARGALVVVGDLASAPQTQAVADQVVEVGGVDAVVHNAGVYAERARAPTAEGHPHTLAVNVLAPYVLTARIVGPTRLIYLSSGMHRSGDRSLDDIDWRTRRWNGTQAYCDSKLHVTALAFALARRWPDRRVHAVDPGWVPTRMGGPSATDDLVLGHRTQAWLAVSDDDATRTPGYWFHQQRQPPASPVLDEAFQDRLLATLAELTGVQLP